MAGLWTWRILQFHHLGENDKSSYSKWRSADPEIFGLCQFMDAGQRSASAAELQPWISSQSTSAKFVVYDFPLDVPLTRRCCPLSTAPVAQHYAARVFWILMYFNQFISLLGRITRVNSVKINNNFFKVTMIFIREIHFSRLVKNCCGSSSG